MALSSPACPLGVESWWPFEEQQVQEAWLGEERPGTRSHSKDRLRMEFISPEIWVSSFSMFFDSFPQLAIRYLLNLATALHWERQVWGLQALSLPLCLYVEAHRLCTHARAGTSSPWACTCLCTGDTRLSWCSWQGGAGASSTSVPSTLCSVTDPWHSHRQVCPCQAHRMQETNLTLYFVPLDPGPSIPIKHTGHVSDHALSCTCSHPSTGQPVHRIQSPHCAVGKSSKAGTLQREEGRSRGPAFAKSLVGVGKGVCDLLFSLLPSQLFSPSQLRCCHSPSKTALC